MDNIRKNRYGCKALLGDEKPLDPGFYFMLRLLTSLHLSDSTGPTPLCRSMWRRLVARRVGASTHRSPPSPPCSSAHFGAILESCGRKRVLMQGSLRWVHLGGLHGFSGRGRILFVRFLHGVAWSITSTPHGHHWSDTVPRSALRRDGLSRPRGPIVMRSRRPSPLP
jgi:hypothetical protein